jgi:hypothetical protein
MHMVRRGRMVVEFTTTYVIATFNNILVISWLSVLLVEETLEPGNNHRPVASHWQTLSHNVVSTTPRLRGIHLTMRITRKSHSSATFILFFYSPIDLFVHILLTIKRGRHSRDRMVVGYLTTYAISGEIWGNPMWVTLCHEYIMIWEIIFSDHQIACRKAV